MALASAYTNVPGRVPSLFSKIREGQAPTQFSQQLLKDWGFSSSNDRPFLPLLKSLGFLSADGKPTQAYHDYRDHSKSKAVLGSALRDKYSDIFLIKDNPTAQDKSLIEGKFKSYHNVGGNVAKLMTRTFLALLELADISNAPPQKNVEREPAHEQLDAQDATDVLPPRGRSHAPGLHYNIQIHLPPTKDVEVYNAIFKSLKEHLFDQ